jgi:chromosome segregation protein
LENEISVLREKRSNSSELIERNRDDIKALSARQQILGEQKAESEKELAERRTHMASLAQQLTEAETAQADADRRLLAARVAKESENRQLVELEGRLSSGKTEEGSLHQQEEELQTHLEDIKRQIEINRAQGDAARAEAESLRVELDQANARKHDAEAAAAELNAELEKLVDSGEELSLEIASLTASTEACLARRHLLEDMMLHYEGHDTGVVAAMEVRDRWPGIAGTVAEKFVPVEGLEAAVEAALGEFARFIICENRTTAEAIIAFLKTEKKGRIGILVPYSGTLNPAVKRPEIDLPEFVGWLDSFITADEGLRPLMQAVLSRVAVFRQGYDPAALLERLPYGFKAVSTDGIVYGKNVITGGSEDQFPLFRRREKVAEQDKIATELGEKLEGLRGEKSRNTARIASVRAESALIASRMETFVEEINASSERMSGNGYRLKGFETELSRLEKERQGTTERLEKIRHRQYTLGLDYTQLASQKENLVSNMSQAGVALSDLEGAAAEAVENVARVQVRTVEARSRVEQSESKIAHIEELGREMAYTLLAKKDEIEEAGQAITVTSERISGLETKLKQAFDERTELTARQNRLRLSQTDLLERITDREKRLKTIRVEKEAVGQEIHQLEIRLTMLESEVQTVADKIREEYDLDIGAVQPPNPKESLSREQALEHLGQQKELLKKFGAVNLLALEEYKMTSERERFLGEQLTDLTSAKKDLQETIVKINHTARELFANTFAQVKQNFQRMFVELFNGGEADLSLVDPDDPLESDIEITARPRGKKLLNITMMSGGERALTAISLLFSLYMVKPSPFCILDEIDAPLDDANCRRFLQIIHSFSGQTQFIVITHNKITMEAANNLYGITMEQPGISKIVGVRFSDAATAGQSADLIQTETALESPVVSEGSVSGPNSITPGNGDEPDGLPVNVARRLGAEVTLPVEDEDKP